MSSKITHKNKPLSSQSNRASSVTKSKSASKDSKPKDPKLFNMLMANLTKLSNGSDSILNKSPNNAANTRATHGNEPKSLQELAKEYDSRDKNQRLTHKGSDHRDKSRLDNSFTSPKQMDAKNAWQESRSDMYNT